MEKGTNDYPLISVIVPVYNVKKYLSKCMETLLAQNYVNYEIILIDDGSTDGSGIICDEYGSRYDFVNVIHQNNGGLSAARNAGIAFSNGEYVTFVDSDDFVIKTYLSDLYELLTYYDADVAILANTTLLENMDVNTDSLRDVIQDSKCLTNLEALKAMYYGNGFGVSACSKLYRKSIVQEDEFPIGYLCEDQVSVYKILKRCRQISVSEKIGYYYVQRVGSITHTPLLDRDFKTLELLKEQLKEISDTYPQLAAATRYKFARFIMELMERTSFEDQCHFYSILKSEIGNVMYGFLMDSNVRLSIRMVCFIISLGYPFNKMAWKVIGNLRYLIYMYRSLCFRR